MEAQLKAMRVPELKELATKAGLNVAAKLTKDKIIALLLESPNVSSLLDGAPSSGAAASSDSNEASAPAPAAKPAPAKGSIDDLLAPPPEFDWSAGAPAPTVGATPASAAEPAHVAKPVETTDPTPATSNAYGSTATSAAATSAPPATEPASTPEAPASAPIPEIPINPLDGSSKPVAGIVELSEEAKRAARKARFEREWQLDLVRKQAEAAAKPTPKEAAPKKVADAAVKQVAPAPAAKAQPAKTNGSASLGIANDILEKRKARFAAAGDQNKPPTAPAAAAVPAQPAAPLLTGADLEKATVRKNKFNSLLPGQPGYQDPSKTVEASPKRKREEDVEEPAAKKAKSDEITA
ncbi:hypothetical protein CALCODRAFT_483822 [Calocera cornea HHB12733]|uniref:Uncharacterized protein n=1 Tax=Calocera cornea HHB12733 TaxID=1353952 RepID=A0A165FCS9_9BASI|nr:hypothetical protein CALCODRAFT_483822 [Calocera cornea HHB12733]